MCISLHKVLLQTKFVPKSVSSHNFSGTSFFYLKFSKNPIHRVAGYSLIWV